MTLTTKTPLIIHDTDLDGLMGAAVLSLLNSNCTFAPFSYDKQWKVESLFSLIHEADAVYLVDWSIGRDDLLAICAEANSTVHLIDHHKSTLEMLTDLVNQDNEPSNLRTYVIVSGNTGKCSAELAWEYIQTEHRDRPAPFGVELIGRYDTWRDPHHHDVMTFVAGFYAETKGKSWTERIQFLRNLCLTGGDRFVHRMLEIWRPITEYRLDLINSLSAEEMGVQIRMNGDTGIAMNLPVPLLSHAAAFFLRDHPKYKFFMGFTFEGHRVRLSFRSTGDYDCTVLASKFGGGGHLNAAGARISVERLAAIINGGLEGTYHVQ
jgi:oligoribonuclease NrnB/cAMP/cGMP phosphodiesterase (DHH superfamily)